MRDIGKNIRQLRVRKKMTQDELAEKLYVTRQTVSNYETGKSRPDIDMLENISAVLGTDLQTLIYGQTLNPEFRPLIIGFILVGIFGLLVALLSPIAAQIKQRLYMVGLEFFIYLAVKPMLFLASGWTLMQLLAMALQRKPLGRAWIRRVGVILMICLMIWLALSLLYTGFIILDEWLYANHLRGEWEEVWTETDGEPYLSKGWVSTPLPITQILGSIVDPVWIALYRARISYHALFLIFGAVLRLCGIPHKTKSE